MAYRIQTNSLPQATRSSLENKMMEAVQAGDVKTVQSLINQGLSANQLLPNKEFPLHFAISSNQNSIEMVQLLIQSGANLDAKDSQNLTALDRAILLENVPLAKVILREKIGLSAKTALGQAEHFCSSGYLSELKERVSQTLSIDSQKLGGLQRSAYEGNLKNIEKREELNLLDEHGFAPIHYAILGNKQSTFQTLLKAGANPRLLTRSGDSILHLAAMKSSLPLIQLALDVGVQANFQNQRGETALHYAAVEEHLNGMKALIAKGANPSAIDPRVASPLAVFTAKVRSRDPLSISPFLLPQAAFGILFLWQLWQLKSTSSLTTSHWSPALSLAFLGLTITESIQATKNVSKEKNFLSLSLFGADWIPGFGLGCSVWKTGHVVSSSFQMMKKGWDHLETRKWAGFQNIAIGSIHLTSSLALLATKTLLHTQLFQGSPKIPGSTRGPDLPPPVNPDTGVDPGIPPQPSEPAPQPYKFPLNPSFSELPQCEIRESSPEPHDFPFWIHGAKLPLPFLNGQLVQSDPFRGGSSELSDRSGKELAAHYWRGESPSFTKEFFKLTQSLKINLLPAKPQQNPYALTSLGLSGAPTYEALASYNWLQNTQETDAAISLRTNNNPQFESPLSVSDLSFTTSNLPQQQAKQNPYALISLGLSGAPKYEALASYDWLQNTQETDAAISLRTNNNPQFESPLSVSDLSFTTSNLLQQQAKQNPLALTRQNLGEIPSPTTFSLLSPSPTPTPSPSRTPIPKSLPANLSDQVEQYPFPLRRFGLCENPFYFVSHNWSQITQDPFAEIFLISIDDLEIELGSPLSNPSSVANRPTGILTPIPLPNQKPYSPSPKPSSQILFFHNRTPLSFEFDQTQNQGFFPDVETDFFPNITPSTIIWEKTDLISSTISLDSEGNEPKTQVTQYSELCKNSSENTTTVTPNAPSIPSDDKLLGVDLDNPENTLTDKSNDSRPILSHATITNQDSNWMWETFKSNILEIATLITSVYFAGNYVWKQTLFVTTKILLPFLGLGLRASTYLTPRNRHVREIVLLESKVNQASVGGFLGLLNKIPIVGAVLGLYTSLTEEGKKVFSYSQRKLVERLPRKGWIGRLVKWLNPTLTAKKLRGQLGGRGSESHVAPKSAATLSETKDDTQLHPPAPNVASTDLFTSLILDAFPDRNLGVLTAPDSGVQTRQKAHSESAVSQRSSLSDTVHVQPPNPTTPGEKIGPASSNSGAQNLGDTSQSAHTHTSISLGVTESGVTESFVNGLSEDRVEKIEQFIQNRKKRGKQNPQKNEKPTPRKSKSHKRQVQLTGLNEKNESPSLDQDAQTTLTAPNNSINQLPSTSPLPPHIPRARLVDANAGDVALVESLRGPNLSRDPVISPPSAQQDEAKRRAEELALQAKEEQTARERNRLFGGQESDLSSNSNIQVGEQPAARHVKDGGSSSSSSENIARLLEDLDRIREEAEKARQEEDKIKAQLAELKERRETPALKQDSERLLTPSNLVEQAESRNSQTSIQGGTSQASQHPLLPAVNLIQTPRTTGQQNPVETFASYNPALHQMQPLVRPPPRQRKKQESRNSQASIQGGTSQASQHPLLPAANPIQTPRTTGFQQNSLETFASYNPSHRQPVQQSASSHSHTPIQSTINDASQPRPLIPTRSFAPQQGRTGIHGNNVLPSANPENSVESPQQQNQPQPQVPTQQLIAEQALNHDASETPPARISFARPLGEIVMHEDYVPSSSNQEISAEAESSQQQNQPQVQVPTQRSIAEQALNTGNNFLKTITNRRWGW